MSKEVIFHVIGLLGGLVFIFPAYYKGRLDQMKAIKKENEDFLSKIFNPIQSKNNLTVIDGGKNEPNGK